MHQKFFYKKILKFIYLIEIKIMINFRITKS